MPKHLGKYDIIVEWHNEVVDKADEAQRRANAGVANRETKIRVVSDVLKKELTDLWGGAELPDATIGQIDNFSQAMVDKGVSSFKRKGEGELLRKFKKVKDRVAGDRDVSFSDFMKHQYNAAKDAGIISLRSRSASTIESEAYGSDDSAIESLEKKAGARLAAILASEPGADPRFPRDLPGLDKVVQIERPRGEGRDIVAPRVLDPGLPPLHKPTMAEKGRGSR
jgi:hypothetical protein